MKISISKTQIIIGISLLLCLFNSQTVTGETGQKKNLLFIITDQQRYDALSIAGNSVLETPNLDRLASQGAYFVNAYTPCAVCAPARSSILTGHTVENTGMKNNDAYFTVDQSLMAMPTFDEILTAEGYHCEYYGKWHTSSYHSYTYKNPVLEAENGKSIFGPGGQSHIYLDFLNANEENRDLQQGEFYDLISKFPYKTDPLDKYHGMTNAELEAQNLKHSQPDQHGELQIDKEHTFTAFQAKQTIEAIERLKDVPFSITCSFHFPHSPILPTEPYYSMYPPEDMIAPVSISDDMQNSPYKTANGRTNKTDYADPEKIKYLISNYYGLIKEIDDWTGKILDKLDELGLTDNTMVIFTSDHGEMLGAHGMREKNVFYEESAHIPLLIRNPNDIQAGTTVDGYVSTVDLFSTILDYLETPEHDSDGKSLRGLIEGTEQVHGKYVVTEWNFQGNDNQSNYMIVKSGWKLIIPYSNSSTVINALYDLNTDPHEMNNLLGSNPNSADYLDKAKELRANLLEWLAKNKSAHYNGVASRVLAENIGETDNLTKKLMMGYQGWFLCQGDGAAPDDWRHWFNSTKTPSAENIGIDFWPDMSEYTDKYNTEMTYADGTNAQLFSSHDLSTTRKHFEWMRDYNIHGVYLQRFLNPLKDSRFFQARNNILQNVIASSAEYNRHFAVMYDISGVEDDGNLYNKLITDWEYLVDTYNLPNTNNYAYQDGKPVLAIWGIGFKDRGLNPATFEAILDYFHNSADPKYRAYIVGGVPAGWRTLDRDSETSSAWTNIYNSLDMISPWTVGRYNNETGIDNWKTDKIVPDLAECNTNNVDYMPVIWPGFSWLNIHDGPYNQIPRNGGNYYWRQAYNAIESGAQYIYVAMFDEVDEGTAMFKLAKTEAQFPQGGTLVPLDIDGYNLPGDWYLQLADETQKMLDGTIDITSTIPINPEVENSATYIIQDFPTSLDTSETATVSVTMKNSGTAAWTKAELYKLGSQNTPDNTTWGMDRIELDATDNIAPNAEKTFTFDITSPATPGIYNFQWMMIKDGVGWFGDISNNVEIKVGEISNYLDDCDVLTSWNSSQTLILNTTENKQGSGCIEYTGSSNDEFKKVFTTPYNSGLTSSNAVLQFWYYVSDPSLMGTSNQVELGSGGTNDVNEYHWSLSGLSSGWNLISLNVSDASTSNGAADLNAINWFRIYNIKSGSVTTKIDGIKIISNGATPASYDLTVNSGSGDGNYEEGSNVNITADEAPAGQEFDGWIVNSGNASIADINAASTSLTLSAGDASVTATYKDIQTAIINNDVNKEQAVNIYPNPLNQDLLSIDLTGFKDLSNTNIIIRNLLGQTVYHVKAPYKENIVINTKGLLKSSIYLITVQSAQSIISTKLIVE